MSDKTVVIVESPAKAKTINKYLGQNYTVLASFGHVRDLPPKDGSVRPDEDFAMDWAFADKGKQHVDEIAKAVKNADHVLLATDPDREGEAIAWHVLESLKIKKALGHADVKRITFNEVTKTAIQAAIRAPRELDQPLIDAYMARRALDYLFGFTLSPVLWRKLPGSKSAGRVQSVALRLICDREAEIEVFKPEEYWTIESDMQTASGNILKTRLVQLDGKKLEKFTLKNAQDAERAVSLINSSRFKIGEIENKKTKRHPAAPFTTSTLQQEASRKLNMGASRTMRTAQRLYEGVSVNGETVGLISYMRTDGVTLSQDAIDQARGLIRDVWGTNYLPNEPRIYKNKAKNAQEAHEAIRPTDMRRRPEEIAHALSDDERRLYEMIWKRTLASQMESAEFNQMTVDVPSDDQKITFRATGSQLLFDGFLKVYFEDTDDVTADKDDIRIPPVKKDEKIAVDTVSPSQHFTQPPPRYTEASLVKKLEELGIGRPSTYASIIEVLQSREYVRLEGKTFIPEDRGRIVTTFLNSFFNRYVEYDFTADLEEKLDDVSDDRLNWKTVLKNFWGDFTDAINGTKDLTITQVIDNLNEILQPHFFPTGDTTCPKCSTGTLGLRLGKFGAFIGCSQYPECSYTRKLSVSGLEDPETELLEGDRTLGVDPATQLPVLLKRGPYGLYLQLGEEIKEAPAEKEEKTKGKGKGKKSDTPKPKRVSLSRGMNPNELSLEEALKLLSLPREVGIDPETDEMIYAGIGRFGPYLKLGSIFKSIPRDDNVLEIGLNRAISLLAEAKAKGPKVLKDLGSGITVQRGRYGPYLKKGRVMANLPKDADVDTFSLEQAKELIAAKSAKGSKAKTTALTEEKKSVSSEKKATAKKTSAEKTKVEKAPSSKTSTKKSGVKKAATTTSASKKTSAKAMPKKSTTALAKSKKTTSKKSAL